MLDRMKKHCKLPDLDLPDHLKSPISHELMEDPVIIDSGHTYEREMIKKHFSLHGATDPITGVSVNPKVLIDNHELRKACE